MNSIEYDNMASREKNYWWHVGRLRIIGTWLHFLGAAKQTSSILNVGCGTGGTIDTLEDFGAVTNVDISNDAIKYMKNHGYKNIIKVSGIELPFNDSEFDFVSAYDVLEHIDDDLAALSEWSRVIKPKGRIMITVPAYQWLWSGHDVSLHHHRRYTKKNLTDKALRSNLRLVRISYAIVFSLPLVTGFRFINNILGQKTDTETSYVDVPPLTNKIFSHILFTEAILHKYIKMPFGTSVIAIFEKNEHSEK